MSYNIKYREQVLKCLRTQIKKDGYTTQPSFL